MSLVVIFGVPIVPADHACAAAHRRFGGGTAVKRQGRQRPDTAASNFGIREEGDAFQKAKNRGRFKSDVDSPILARLPWTYSKISVASLHSS